MSSDKIITLVAFGFYMALMIIIGVFYSKKTKNNEDYFLGGRNLGGWPAALSAQASDMSGWLLMGLPGTVYLAGTGEVWIAVGLLIGTILNWYIVSSRLRKYTIVAGNSLTIPSFFENRYRDRRGVIKIVSAIIIAIFFAVYTASAFSSGAKLFATLFGDSIENAYLIGLIIAAAVILVYTLLGGFKAVCTTDFIQGMLMLVAILAVPIVAYAMVEMNGGFTASLQANGVADPANYLNPVVNTDGSAITPVSVISSLAWGLGYFGMPHIIIRFMAIKNEHEVKKSRKIAIIWVILSLAAACFVGVVARAFLTQQLDGATSETAFIRLIQQVFSGNGALIFIGGIFLCGILAAIMSTADSQLLVTSSAISEDIFKGVIKRHAPKDENTEKSALLVGRIAVIVIAVAAFLIALDPNSSIMGLVSDAWAGFGSAFGPVVLLALFWKRSTLSGAVAGMATGTVTVIVWDYLPLVGGDTIYHATGLYSLAVGFVLALVINVVVSLLSKKPSQEIVKEFESIKTTEI